FLFVYQDRRALVRVGVALRRRVRVAEQPWRPGDTGGWRDSSDLGHIHDVVPPLGAPGQPHYCPDHYDGGYRGLGHPLAGASAFVFTVLSGLVLPRIRKRARGTLPVLGGPLPRHPAGSHDPLDKSPRWIFLRHSHVVRIWSR